MARPRRADIVVAGAGIAGLAAALASALAARTAGAGVLVLERAPRAERGGNTRFSNGALRAVYAGADDVDRLAGPLSDGARARTDFGSYHHQRYLDDLGRITGGRADPALARALVDNSADALAWLSRHGVGLEPLYDWQFHASDGRITFQGGSAFGAKGGGEGLSAALFAAVERHGVEVLYEARARELLTRDGRVAGVRVDHGGEALDIEAKAVVLACGGFEADAGRRAQYLGPEWDAAKVRGSRFNTGDGLAMALAAGAAKAGDWSGCHSAGWDANAPAVNAHCHGTIFKRDDFMYGIVVNRRGERFFDEGADIRAVTYARLGRAILAQPGGIAWQVFDAKAAPLLHAEYRDARAAHVAAGTLPELAGRLDGIDAARLLATVSAYNRAIDTDVPFDPARKDGRSTRGLAIPKSNWAAAIDTPPFEAWTVQCGITFTFGGIRADADGQVTDTTGRAIAGLLAAGEMVGGLFYDNYPGGSGLMSAAVQGRAAGVTAAASLRG